MTGAIKLHAPSNRFQILSLGADELEDGRRIVLESDDLVAYVPYAARYPYEINITTKAHRPLIEDLNSSEVKQLALMLKRVIYKYNQLFGFEMPYIMAHHQAKAQDYDCQSYHWHIEFYPPYRTAEKLKYLAVGKVALVCSLTTPYPRKRLKYYDQ